ncbi:MAG: PKD domain-containing protein, partial [Bacteroidia bacterium]
VTLSDFPTTPGSFSPLNKSPRCSNASYKLDFRLSDIVVADFFIAPRNSCTDTLIHFTNNSYNGKHYYWFIDNILKDTTANFIFAFTKKGMHEVKLVAVDSTRCIIIDSLTKTLNIASSSKSDFSFKRDSCSFTMAFTNKTNVAHGDTIPYFWRFGDGDTSSQINPSHKYYKGGNYTVTLISNPNTLCSDSVQKTFYMDTTIYMLEARFTPVPAVSCIPSSVLFQNQSINGKLFLWYYNNVFRDTTRQFSDSFFTVQNITVKLVVKDSISCKKTDSVSKTIQIFASAKAAFAIIPDTCGKTFSFINQSTSYHNLPYKFIWYFGDGDTSTQNNPVHKYFSNGTFNVKLVCNPGINCADSNIQLINYDSNFYFISAAFTPSPWNGCAPQKINCTNNTANHGQRFYWYENNNLKDTSFNFSDSLVIPNLYRIKLVAIDSATCNISDSITQNVMIDVSSKSVFDWSRDTCSPLVNFYNRTTTFNNQPILVYIWDFGDGTTSTDKDPAPHQFPKNGTYVVTLISGSFPCADTSSQTIIYDSLANVLKADFSFRDSVLCVPQFLQTKNNSTGGKYFYWFVNNSFTDTSFQLKYQIKTAGLIKVRLVVVDSSRCKIADTTEKTVTAANAALPDFGYSRDSCSLVINFINKTGMNGIAYHWSFGDGDSSIEINPKHTYTKGGNYQISLIAEAGTTCADTITKEYNFEGDTTDEVKIPNVFTPNGDGMNDLFEIRGLTQCDQFHIIIYNRWGTNFFESSDPNISWDGNTEKGIAMSDGIYFFILDIKRHNGKEIHAHGIVTLIRGKQ